MKKIPKIYLIVIFIFSSIIVLAQPPNPDGDPNSGGGTPLGGPSGAPISGGLAVFLLLGAIYGGRKAYLVLSEYLKEDKPV